MLADVVLIVVAVIAMVVGVAGCVLPVLPGVPLCYLGLVLLKFSYVVDVSMVALVIFGLTTVFVSVADYVVPMIGTKRFGGGRYGQWGCVVGSVVGLFFSPLGILIGPFVGAVLGELIAKKTLKDALKAGFGSFVGFLTGVLMKMFACLAMIIYFFYLLVTSSIF